MSGLTFPWLLLAEDGEPTPGSPPAQALRYTGPWFQTQLSISLLLGLLSFVTFCLCRRRYKVLFAPRTLLKGFSPHEVHTSETLLGWILPTLRTSEYAVLQLVGLDAAVVSQLRLRAWCLIAVQASLLLEARLSILRHLLDPRLHRAHSHQLSRERNRRW
jgi:hypothetical protein